MERGRRLARLAAEKLESYIEEEKNSSKSQSLPYESSPTTVNDESDDLFGDDSDKDPPWSPTMDKEKHFKRIFSLKTTMTTKIDSKVVTCLQTRLVEYEKQHLLARHSGCKSTLRRKAKRISLYKDLLEKAKKGHLISVENLPDPFSSPFSKNRQKQPSSNTFCRALNFRDAIVDGSLIDKISKTKDLNSTGSYQDKMRGKGNNPFISEDMKQPPLNSVHCAFNCRDPMVDESRSEQITNRKPSNSSGPYEDDLKDNGNNAVISEEMDTCVGPHELDIPVISPVCEVNINKKIKRKENFCITCKKMVKEFCKHYEHVHHDTEEGQKLKALNNVKDKIERKKLKTKITESLRKRGNAEFSKNKATNLFVQGKDATVIPVKRFNKGTANQANCVQCTYCQGYYNRRKFCRHLRTCQMFLGRHANTNTSAKLEGKVNALSQHCLPIIDSVEGASDELVKEILTVMKPRKAKDVALRDPLIMKYASEFYKTRRASFQKMYVSRVIIDLAKILMRVQEVEGEENITCLEDCLTPEHFSLLVSCILKEGGYDDESGNVDTCGLGNRLRSHIKAAAETAKTAASAREYKEKSQVHGERRKRLKHFLMILEEKWANEVGRIFDMAVKKSRSEKDPKLAVEDDIVKTCQYVTSNYRTVISKLDGEAPGSITKQKLYNQLMDLLVTHIMCLIRRRPVDFKRALNLHYERMNIQEDLISEIKNSQSMNLSDKDLELCNKFKIFYVPGKGWKEMVPIALTNLMKDALDAIQRNKPHVGVSNSTLFVRAGDKPIDPRESMKKVTKNVVLKKPLHMTGNGLRHHAGTFSKLHSTHPQYQDYLASALGHTLHIHRLHYEMPTSITQKLIVCPVLHKMTVSNEEENETPQDVNNLDGNTEERVNDGLNYEEENETPQDVNNLDGNKEDQVNDKLNYANREIQDVIYEDNPDSPDEITSETGIRQQFVLKTPEKDFEEDSTMGEINTSLDLTTEKSSKISRQRWTDQEKQCVYKKFGTSILQHNFPPRSSIAKFYLTNIKLFPSRSLQSVVTFIHNKCLRKQKNVTPEAKKYMSSSHRRITNVPI